VYFNKDLDKAGELFVRRQLHPAAFEGGELTAPTAPGVKTRGIFRPPSMTIAVCGDDAMTSPPWDYGTATQNNVLTNMPGPNVQIR